MERGVFRCMTSASAVGAAGDKLRATGEWLAANVRGGRGRGALWSAACTEITSATEAGGVLRATGEWLVAKVREGRGRTAWSEACSGA